MQEKFQLTLEERVKKNLAEGRGLRIMDLAEKNKEVVFLILQVLMNFGELP